MLAARSGAHRRQAHAAAEGAGLLRPDQIYRARRGARRHREPEAGAQRREGGGGVRHRDLAVQSRALLREPLLRLGRGISRGARATRCTRNTRRSSTAGFLLQIDDPRMATHYNRARDASIEDCRKFIALRVEAVNHALRGIPEDRVRFHTCYSVNIAPRVHDFELKHFADLMLKINAARLPDRGREPAPRARMGGLAGGEAAGRQDPGARRGVALHPPGRAPGTGGAAHRALRRRGRARARDRRHRLRLRHLGRRRRGASATSPGRSSAPWSKARASPASGCGGGEGSTAVLRKRDPCNGKSVRAAGIRRSAGC